MRGVNACQLLVCRNRLTGIASGIQGDRGPEVFHARQMRGPGVTDLFLEDRPQIRVSPHAGIEGFNEVRNIGVIDAHAIRMELYFAAALFGGAQEMVHAVSPVACASIYPGWIYPAE